MMPYKLPPKKRLSISLKTLRAKSQWSQDGAAKAIGIKRGAYYSYEEGRAFPSILILIKITQVFNVTIDQLLLHE